MGGAGRAAGLILAAWAVGQGAGLPAGCAVPVGPLADFGSVSGVESCEISRGVGNAGRPARANKEKSSVCGAVGRGISGGASDAGKPASRFWQSARRGGVCGFPAKPPA